jgi:DNA-binding NtrC family response regulator
VEAVPGAAAASTAVPRRAPLREYPDILGRSAALRRALAQLDAAVDTDLPVLVHGETGVGKELFARALHDHGARRAAPFVAVNCAAIADALFEAELFGHARSAFTGADRARPGLLARAEGGTLLLDELGELPILRQATLLRALEARRYRPVGSDEERPFDVRIVAATNRDLDASVEDGSFRRDLVYRIRVLEIAVPPLRERAGDVEALLRHFLARAGSRAIVTPAALRALDAYPFPGNVRELAHLAQRLAASGVERIDVSHLPRSVRSAALARAAAARGGAHGDEPGSDARAQRAELEAALETTSGNISRAAVLLGLTRHGLKKRMLRLGVRGKVKSGTDP